MSCRFIYSYTQIIHRALAAISQFQIVLWICLRTTLVINCLFNQITLAYTTFIHNTALVPTLFHNFLQLDGGDAVSLLMDSPIELSLARTKGTRKHPHQGTKTTHKSLFGNMSLEALITVTILSSKCLLVEYCNLKIWFSKRSFHVNTTK